jgi:hypothetical protein
VIADDDSPDDTTKRLRLWLGHWRLGLHLLLGTRRLGVNNRPSESFRSWLRRPLFGFGWRVLAMPWRWPALWSIVRLRLEIAGFLYSSGGRCSSPPESLIRGGSCESDTPSSGAPTPPGIAIRPVSQ